MSTSTYISPKVAEAMRLSKIIEADDISQKYSQFVAGSWPIIEPGTTFLHNWHIDLLGEHLQDVRDSITTRLVVNMPPRYMKSILITVDYAPWVWTTEPEERFLFTSYDDKLVKKHSVQRRNIIESEWYQERWGALSPAPPPEELDRRVILSSDQNEKKEFMNTRAGLMLAAPVGGGLTGHGGNTIIIDDPQNPKEADSETQRQDAEDFYTKTLLSRLNDKKRGRIIVVMQRLHKKDLTGYVLEEGGFVHVKLEAIATKKTFVEFPRSKRVLVREKDNVLWEEREDRQTLDRTKIAVRPTTFSGQWQQEPTELEGVLLKRSWWKYYAADDLVAVAPPNHVLIEDKANGPAVISVLQQKILGLRPVEPMGSKLARASAASGALQSGQCILPAEESELLLPTRYDDTLKTKLGDFDEIVDSWDCAFKDTDQSDFVVGTKWGRKGANIYLLALVRDRMNFPETAAAILSLARTTIVKPLAVKVPEFVDELAAFRGIATDTDDQVDSWSQAVLHFVLSMGGMIAWLEKAYAEQEAKQLEEKKKAEDERDRFKEKPLWKNGD